MLHSGSSQKITITNDDGKSTGALTVTLSKSPPTAGFMISSDLCSGVALGPNKTCSVTVSYPGAAPQATQTATLTVASKKPLVATVSSYFSIAPANPVLANVESSTLQYNAGTPAVAVTSSLTISAPTTTLVGGTVTINAGFAASEDSLGFTNQNGITGSYNASTGVLTLSGSASIANYQTALRSVTYSDSNGVTPSIGSRTISFQVDDGLSSNNLSNITTRTVSVNPNPAPTAGSVSASTDKHTAIDVNVLSSASDSDGDTLSVASVDTTGTKGSVSINPSGTIHYDPNNQFQNLLIGQSATDTFTYKVSDGFQDSSSATVTVTVNGTNDPPVLANIETAPLQYNAGTPAVTVTSALTVSSPDTTTLAGGTVSISSGLAASEDSLAFTNQNGITGSYNSSTGLLTLSGTASVVNYQSALRSVSYSDSNGTTPSTGSRSISFQVDDGLASNNLSNITTRTVSVNPNSPPSAVNDSAATDKHTAVDINVLANDSDPDGDALTVQSVNTSGTLGSVSINVNQTVHYDPNGQFQGLTQGQTATDTFTYTVSDGFTTATATVTMTINGVNDPPVISNIETTAQTYRAQDPAVQITSALMISDDDDATMSSATVSITSGFSATNDSLESTSQNGITGSYNAATGVLTLSGTASIANYQTALQSVMFFTSDGSVSPAARTISFAVTDSVGATSTGAAQRTIDVSEANQPPVAVPHSYTAVGNTPLGVGTTPTGPAATTSGSLLNGDSDPDSGGAISVTGNSSPAHGTVTVNADGTFTYEPNAGFSSTDSFTYTITDSDDPSNPKSATATVTITVGPVVWYVDDTKALAGTGQANAPFNTLAAVNTAAGANSIIFLYQGNATYTGGVTMHSGEDLFGQPHGLTVDSYSLVAAGGSNPTITNSSGDGIVLANNADVEDITVSGASGNGISGSGVTGTISIIDSTVTASTVNNAIITDTSGTLSLTVTGSTFSNDTATGSTDPDNGLQINANGSTNATVSVTGSTFSNNLGNAFFFTTDTAATGTNSVTFSNNTATDNGNGPLIEPSGTSHTTITVDGNTIHSTATGNIAGIEVDLFSSGSSATLSGTINGNTVGVATVANSGGGDGIGIFAEGVPSGTTYVGGGTVRLAITNNTLFQYQNGAGISFLDRQGSPTMSLTITGNTIADPGKFGSWGLLGEDGALSTDNGPVCVAIGGNSLTGSAAAGQGGADVELDQNGATTFNLAGYTGGTSNTSAVETFLQGRNTPSGGTAPSAIALVSGSGGGFVGVSGCAGPS
jgi:VCBS repeat-containing protein